jgi:hypothetical protein
MRPPGRAAAAARRAPAPKRLFLSEFEISGSIPAAARAAGCTPVDVRRWRASDAMFARDFALAALAHVKTLKRIVEAIAASSLYGAEAHQLLEAEHRFTDPDGRLDVAAWRDALHTLIRKAGVDPATWEPSLA